MDNLSRLTLINSYIKESVITGENLSGSYCVYKLDSDILPLPYRMIDRYQRKYKELTEKRKRENYHTKHFRGGGNILLIICQNDKIFMPLIIQKYVVNWYHTYLLHLGM